MTNQSEFVKILLGAAKLLLTYIGVLLTYELVLFFHSGEFAIEIAGFDPYLVVVAAFIGLVGWGIQVFRTHPGVQDHLPSGSFGINELIIIESVTIIVTVDRYVRSTGTGVELLANVLFVALLTLSGVVSVLLILRWAYLGPGNSAT